MNGSLDWKRDGPRWPNREASKFVHAGGLTWHVQDTGHGPTMVLIHGTAASTHSWGKVMPKLAQSFRVIAFDLPGHGFTTLPSPTRLSLPGMAAAVGELIEKLDIKPVVAVGHSAGAAIAIRASLDGFISPCTIVSINGALLPFESVAGQFFSPLAKLLVSAPGVAQLAAWRGKSRTAVERVIAGTGSPLTSDDLDYYVRLFSDPRHVGAALAMMANWDLRSFARDLPRLKPHLILLAARHDRAISPRDADKVSDLVPSASVQHLERGGHLVHEEYPGTIALIIEQAAKRACPSRAAQAS